MMAARRWQSLEFLREVYVSSDGHYHFDAILSGRSGLHLEYSGGHWLYANSRDFRVFDPPKYVEAMITDAFKARLLGTGFTFYEYRKMGNELVKDTDPDSLRYFDAETWRWECESMLGKGGE